jgi:hypothetical protein
MADEFVKFERKRFNFISFFIKSLIFIILILAFYFLYIFGIIRKEYFSFIFDSYELMKNVISLPVNSGKFVIAFFIILVTNLSLAFFLLFRKTGGVNTIKIKTEYAQKAKKMEDLLSDMREEMSNRKVKFKI